MAVCSRCKWVHYCDQQCQKTDFKEHQAVCCVVEAQKASEEPAAVASAPKLPSHKPRVDPILPENQEASPQHGQLDAKAPVEKGRLEEGQVDAKEKNDGLSHAQGGPVQQPR